MFLTRKFNTFCKSLPNQVNLKKNRHILNLISGKIWRFLGCQWRSGEWWGGSHHLHTGPVTQWDQEAGGGRAAERIQQPEAQRQQGGDPAGLLWLGAALRKCQVLNLDHHQAAAKVWLWLIQDQFLAQCIGLPQGSPGTTAHKANEQTSSVPVHF